MFNAALDDYFNLITHSEPIFFDRGIPDVIGYLGLCGLPVPFSMIETARNNRYHSDVFITPPWQEIYENDKERKQDFAEAVRTYEMMKEVYPKFGYRLVEVPRLPVSDRVCFILDHLHDVL
jgi:predicted ATPase